MNKIVFYILTLITLYAFASVKGFSPEWMKFGLIYTAFFIYLFYVGVFKSKIAITESLKNFFASINAWKNNFISRLKQGFNDIKQLKGNTGELATNKNHSFYRLLFYLLVLISFIFIPYLSFDYGITMDEPQDHIYFEKVFNYFKTFGEDKSCLDENAGVNSHLVNYGPFVNLLCVVVAKYISPFGLYETRHIVISLFGCIGLLFTGLLARKLGNWRMACLAFLFMLLSPFYFGHSMNNQKDIPFAAFYITSLYFIVKYLLELPKPSARTLFLLTVSIGITLSIRIGGLLLIAYLVMFAGLYWLYLTRKNGLKNSLKEGFSLLKNIGVVGALAYLIGIIIWPYALQSPLSNPLKSLSGFEKFSLVHIWELFEGKRYYMKDFPWYYVPKSIAITAPLFIILGFLVSFKDAFSSAKKFFFGILIFTLIFPITYLIYKHSAVYSSWRHMLFVYSPMVVLAAYGWDNLLSINKKAIRIAVASVLFILLGRVGYWMVKNHPYEYVYYNEFVGGVNGAYGNYETDYWCQSPKEAIEWLIENDPEVKTKRTAVASNNVTQSLSYYSEKMTDSVKVLWARESEWGKQKYDYAIWTTRTLSPTQLKNGYFPPKGTIHVIKVDDVPLAAIVKVENTFLPDGYRLMDQRKLPEAIESFKKAAAYNPLDEEPCRAMAMAQTESGDFDNAITNFNKSIQLRPENFYSYLYLGLTYLRKNDFDNAIKSLSLSIKHKINNSMAYEVMGDAYLNTQQFDFSLKSYETSMSYAGPNEHVYNKMGKAFLGKYMMSPQFGEKNLDEAMNYFNAAIQMNPKFPEFYQNMAYAFSKKGNNDMANKYMQQAKALSGK